MSEKNPILSISLLASNRKDTTKKCLDSLKMIMERIDCELIIVDTGCDEEMQALLHEYTDQIIPFTWCNDFSKARNAGLEKCSGEWFLYIDDDEWFENVDELVEFFQSGEYKTTDRHVIFRGIIMIYKESDIVTRGCPGSFIWRRRLIFAAVFMNISFR